MCISMPVILVGYVLLSLSLDDVVDRSCMRYLFDMVCDIMHSVIDYCLSSRDKFSGLLDSTLTHSLLFPRGLTSIRFLVLRRLPFLNLLPLVCCKTWMQILPFLPDVRSACFESILKLRVLFLHFRTFARVFQQNNVLWLKTCVSPKR